MTVILFSWLKYIFLAFECQGDLLIIFSQLNNARAIIIPEIIGKFAKIFYAFSLLWIIGRKIYSLYGFANS